MSGDRISNWPETYSRRTVEPAEAVALVQPGDCVVIPIGSITPNLATALFERGDALGQIDLLTCAPYIDPGWFEPGHPAFRTHIEIFNTVIGRQSHNAGRSDFLSIPFSRRFKGTDERGTQQFNPDVTLISISPRIASVTAASGRACGTRPATLAALALSLRRSTAATRTPAALTGFMSAR